MLIELNEDQVNLLIAALCKLQLESDLEESLARRVLDLSLYLEGSPTQTVIRFLDSDFPC